MATAASPIVIEPRAARISANDNVAISTTVLTSDPAVVSASRRRTSARSWVMRTSHNLACHVRNVGATS